MGPDRVAPQTQERRGLWRAVLDYFRYWQRVWLFAFRRTWGFLGPPFHFQTLVPVFAFGGSILVLRQLGEEEVANDELLWALAGLGSLAAVFAAAFIANLAYAPVGIDREQRNRLRELSPKPVLDLVSRAIDQWVYIAVTNNGEADDFVAQVLEVVKDDKMVTPWSMRWRHWEEESRPILKDDTRLLQAGLAIQEGRLDEKDRRAHWFGYRLLTTTAEFKSGWWVRHYWGKNDEVEDPTPEDELKVLLGLYVRVRGEQHNAEGGGWLSLGFDPDGNPIATIEESEPMLSDANTEDSQNQSA